ncbi:hypothetical protein [Demequina rhizosphaerae]|uniref:hypothetical protein n=1 Tax=Demequina rhizosphaerae TaxID=1638985 RepID=UPI000A9B3280|nr:hypothetical protein [Demequina rhizosphaerae]
MLRELRANRGWKRLLTPIPQFSVHFSKETCASSLWAYGEDDLADRALTMTDAELTHVQTIASHFEDPDFALPAAAKRITHNHVMALAAVAYFERRIRPLALGRRRPQKLRPAKFAPTAPEL